MKFYTCFIPSLLVLLMVPAAFATEPHHKTEKAVTSTTSLNWLINGNTRFMLSKNRKDGAAPKDVERLSSGQKPHAIILSCSDSRVPPEVVFDQKLGEIFVVRTAGESLGDNVIGSIEYAVEHLGPQLLVVMGHTSCGAVKAAISTLAGGSAGSPALDSLVKGLHPHLQKFKGQKPSQNFEQEAWANTDGVAADLLQRSTIVSQKVKSGELTIIPSLYDVHTGYVVFSDPILNASEKRKLSQATPTPKRKTSSESTSHHKE